ncbi:MAG: SOUL family heme-binding protein [Micrococcales bacterium]
MTEQLPYQVKAQFPGFELRHYPSHLIARVKVQGEFIDAGNIGFGPLVRYISGNNQAGQKLAMTAPVIQETPASKQNLVSFVLPQGTSLDTVGIPNDGSVELVSVPPHDAVALRFSGRWDEQVFREREAELRALVDSEIAAGKLTGRLGQQAQFARYDPPFKPWFLRRNEVLIEFF